MFECVLETLENSEQTFTILLTGTEAECQAKKDEIYQSGEHAGFVAIHVREQ